MASVTQRTDTRWNQAPKKPGGQNPFLGVLGGLVREVTAKTIDVTTERRLIDQAAYYAKRNKLPFTPTMAGVVKMAQHADEMHRMHMAAIQKRERDEFNPSLRGYDRATGFEA